MDRREIEIDWSTYQKLRITMCVVKISFELLSSLQNRVKATKVRATAMVLVGLISASQFIYFYRSIVNYDPPFPEMPDPQVARRHGPRLASGMILIVVDGLRMDASYSMRSLNSLRAFGTDSISIAGIPSLSVPADSVLFTGAWQEFSGVTTNWYDGTGVDSVFDEAKMLNLSTAIVGDGGVDTLFGRSILYRSGYLEDQIVLERSLALIECGRFDLLVVYFTSLDKTGHRYGGKSDEYKKAVADIDRYINNILNRIDLGKSVVVVTADHGHRDEGGHGGSEPEVVETPLVIAGKGIRRVNLGLVNQSDVAPTICAILGIPIPLLSQGRPLIHALDVDAEMENLLMEINAEQKSNLYAKYRIYLGLDKKIIGPANASSLPALMKAVYESKQERLMLESQHRLPWMLLICLIPLIYLCRRIRNFTIPLLGLLIYLVLRVLIYQMECDSFTLSSFNSESSASFLFLKWPFEFVASLLAVSVAVGLVARLRRMDGKASEERAADSIIVIFETILVQMAYYVYGNAIGVSWALPDIVASFDFFLQSLQATIIGLAFPVWTWVARTFTSLTLPS